MLEDTLLEQIIVENKNVNNNSTTKMKTITSMSYIFNFLFLISQFVCIFLCIIMIIILLLVPSIFSIIIYFKLNGLNQKSSTDQIIYSSKPSYEFQNLVNPLRNIGNTTNQFIGGDSSLSVTIDFGGEKYVVWIYGDTLVGPVDKFGNRKKFDFIHNSVGVQKIDSRKQLKFFWNTKPDGHATALYDPPHNKTIYYWLMQGVSIKQSETKTHLYLFTPRVLLSKFLENDGITIIKCEITKENIMDAKKWTISFHDMPFSIANYNDGIDFGITANAILDDYLYMFGRKKNIKNALMLRMKIQDFEQFNWNKVEYFCQNSVWKTGRILGEEQGKLPLKTIDGFPQISETNVQYHKGLKKWISMRFPEFAGKEIFIYTSDMITGPYKKQWVYSVPEWVATGMNIASYAVKTHLQFCNEENIIFSYNTNVIGGSGQIHNLFQIQFEKFNGLYIPQFVELKIHKLKQQ